VPTLEERLEALEIVLHAILPHMSRQALGAAASELRGQAGAMDAAPERTSQGLALNLILAAEAWGPEAEDEEDEDDASSGGVVLLAKALDALQLLDKAVDALIRDFAGPRPNADQLDELAEKLVTKPSFLKIVGDLDMANAIAAILHRRAGGMRAAVAKASTRGQTA